MQSAESMTLRFFNGAGGLKKRKEKLCILLILLPEAGFVSVDDNSDKSQRHVICFSSVCTIFNVSDICSTQRSTIKHLDFIRFASGAVLAQRCGVGLVSGRRRFNPFFSVLVVVDAVDFYIVLFSAFEQTHCTLVACH